MPEGKKEKEELDYIIQNYRKHFEFSYSLEKGMNAFNLTIDYLGPSDITKIRNILGLISDQFSDDPNKIEIDMFAEDLKKTIKDLASNKNKKDMEIICQVFRSLMEIPPDLNPDRSKPIRPHRCY
jgi:hypothetical protein